MHFIRVLIAIVLVLVGPWASATDANGPSCRVILATAVYQPNPSANTGTPIPQELAIWFPKAGLQTTIDRAAGEVRYQFWDGHARRELHIQTPHGVNNAILKSHEVLTTPDDLRLPHITERSAEKINRLRHAQLEKRIHVALAELYHFAAGDSQIDPGQSHERLEAARYLQMLGSGEVNQLDARLLIPPWKAINWPFLIDRPEFRVGGNANGSVDQFYFREHQVIPDFDPFLFFVNAVKDYGILFKLKQGKAGLAFHVDRADGTSLDFEILAGEAFYSAGRLIDPFYKNLPPAIWGQIISIYRERIKGIPEEVFKKAEEISKHCLRRSFILSVFDGKDSFTTPHFEPAPYPNPIPQTLRDPNQIQVKGALTLVMSSSPDELMPLELLLDIRVPRKGKKVLEVGRLGLPRGESLATSLSILKLATALGNGANDIDEVYVLAETEAHARKWERTGFKPVPHAEANAKGAVILMATPADLLKTYGLN